MARGKEAHAVAQKGSNTRPHSGLHWSAAVGIHSAGHVPVAQPLRQAASVVITCTLPKRSEMVHSSVWTACGGAPPICAAACALAPPRSDSAHAAAAATLTVAITGEGWAGASRGAGKRRGFSASESHVRRPSSRGSDPAARTRRNAVHSYQYLLYITGQYGTVHSEIIIYPYGVRGTGTRVPYVSVLDVSVYLSAELMACCIVRRIMRRITITIIHF